MINLIEGFLKACTGFPVNFANDLLQRIERLFEIRVLRIQIPLAL